MGLTILSPAIPQSVTIADLVDDRLPTSDSAGMVSRGLILTQLRIMNVHLSSMSGEQVTERDLTDDY